MTKWAAARSCAECRQGVHAAFGQVFPIASIRGLSWQRLWAVSVSPTARIGGVDGWGGGTSGGGRARLRFQRFSAALAPSG